MKKLYSQGHKLSDIDHKAFEHFCLGTPKEWLKAALDGWINRAVKTIIKDWEPKYAKLCVDVVPTDPEVLIPAILAMPEFKPYNVPTPVCDCVNRTDAANIEIVPDGFDIKDYEHAALHAYYADHDGQLHYLMENKIKSRREAFVHEHKQISARNKEAVPANEDLFISHMTAKAGYKNRSAVELERNADTK